MKSGQKQKKCGIETLYNGQVHDDSILEFLSQGYIPEDFCKHWGIVVRTYHKWKKAHPSFKEAAKRGTQYGMALWLRMPLHQQESGFSHQYWSLIMRNVYGWGSSKVKALAKKDMSPKEIIDATINLLARGKIQDRLADRFNTLAMSKMRIIELTELESRIANLEGLAGKIG